MSNGIPAEVFPPGEYIRDELEARGWTQQDLALILGRPANAVNQIIAGKRSITPETAKGLAAAFGTSADFWMNLENAYQLAQVEADDEDEVAHRARLYSVAPVNEMTKRGWLEPADVAGIDSQLKRFFDTADLDSIPAFAMAARKSSSYSVTSVPLRAWAFRAIRLARTVSAGPFNPDALAAKLPQLRGATLEPNNLRKLPLLLASWGVRLVLVQHLEKTRVDGAALWLDERSPVVALSLRYDRIDYFWHTLIHELVHVKRGDGSIDSDIVPDAKGEGGSVVLDALEERTNAETCEVLVPQEKLNSFIIRTAPLYSRDKVVRFAQANGVHPGVVLGQLHHRYLKTGQGIHPKNLRDLLVPIRQHILTHTITDGWGHQAGAF